MSKIIADTNKIKEVLEKGVEKIYPSKEALEKTLKSGTRIKLYCGFDPTSPNLHIGSAVQFRKLAQFQKLGHEVIMLIGDFTTMIGDPTDKSAARKKITRKEILKNAKNYKNLASKILRFSGENPAKIMYNSQWNDKLTFVELIELASNFTVQQMIIRDMFQERLKKDRPIYLHEFLYPLTQAYDSVAMDVDLEVGGNDQTFNMLCGRDLMKVLKNKEKFVLTTKLLMDPLGKKMGKTEGNMINLDEKPNEMYGKIMSWPDSLIFPGFELCTDLSIEEVNQIKKKKNNPRDDKARLAREIVAIHHNKVVAQKAEKEFNRVFKERGTPSEVKSYKLGVKNLNILDLLFKTGLASSKSEAKRLVEQGAIKIDKSTVKDWRVKINIKKGIIIQAGKRKFIKLV
ncbi:MAG: tyrosine--tRNA ligase [Candidatus Portnoybacteria bacterium RBG_13_40_8]|uniref:Tyrosine--tRNA ligase n=1 Tax=Candidatus Portnoybacteria bacterium RBG_13_40_8 TaxID=1801990 RepID=A0A1G2F1Y8_9BACT|nr:MAG: tyrosine--tRNA ligase [Candidatus Portnoybacteria bacterium RBG_13_40_8]